MEKLQHAPFPCFPIFQIVTPAIAVGGYLTTNITGTDTSSTPGVWTKATASFPAPSVIDRSTNATVCVFTCCTCTRSTAPTNAACATNASLSHPASTNTCECTVARDPTSVHTASRPSPPRPFYAPIFDSTAERNRSSAGIADGRSPRTRHTIVTCGERTQRKNRAFVNTVEKRSLSRMSSSFTGICTPEQNPTFVRSAAERFRAPRRAIATEPTSIALRGKTERRN